MLRLSASAPHAVFDGYGGSAAALSVAVHVAIAMVGLCGGAVWFENSAGGARRGDRPAMSWVALPPISSSQAETPPTPTPRSTAPAVAPPRIEPVKLQVSPRVVASALSIPLRASVPDLLPAPEAIDDGVSGPGQGPSCGGGREVGAMPGADAGSSSDSARDVFGPTAQPAPITPAEAPPDEHRSHDVQFWIRADGRVTRIAVSPPIRDSHYRRRFRQAMSTFVFGPVKTPDGRPIDYVYNCVVSP